MIVKHTSRRESRDKDGINTAVAYLGSREEAVAMQNDHPVGLLTAMGKVKTTEVYQEAASQWVCSITFATDTSGDPVNEPDTAYGKKSATLQGSCLSCPLETHPDYRVCWDHYLATTLAGTPAVPAFWETATDTRLSGTDWQQYRWVRSLSELPFGPDNMGRVWQGLTKPEMPGVNSYDVAVYVVRESIRCRTDVAAGALVAGKLNKIVTPSFDFGIGKKDAGNWNWKCDDAGVSWTGKYWLATLSYTRSGDKKGWNTKLYTRG